MGGTLKVTVDGLRALSQCCVDQAGQLVASPPSPVTAASWQTTGTAANTVSARGSKVTTTMGARLTANAAKFAQAANDYETQDQQSGAALSQSEFNHTAASSGGDGGAGGSAVAPPAAVVPAGGADGGAGAFPAPR